MKPQKGIVLLTAIILLAAIATLILFLYEGTLLTTIESRNVHIHSQLYQKSMRALQQLHNEINATNVAGLARQFSPCLVTKIPEHLITDYLTTHWQNQFNKGCGAQILPFQYAYFIERLNENACAPFIKQGQLFAGVRFYRLTFYSQQLGTTLHTIVQTTFAIAAQQPQTTCQHVVRQAIRPGWLSWREIIINE